MQGMKLRPILALGVLLFISCNTQREQAEAKFGDEEVTTYILVRHAEKDYGGDPVLTQLGIDRANHLAETLTNTDLHAVYSTDTRRTRLTAKPVAKDHKLKVKIYDVALIRDFANFLKYNHRGKTVLVVGHSNTTPALANLLTDTDSNPRFDEMDYANLLIVTLPRIGRPRVLKLRY